MRQQRTESVFGYRSQAGSIKPALISLICFGIFALGVGVVVLGAQTDETTLESQRAADLSATVKTFEVDTDGIIGGQVLGISGQLRVNNTLVLNPSSQPAQTTAGQIYYDETANKVRFFDGTSFQGLVSDNDVAALQQQPAAQRPVVASPQTITNLTQQFLTQQTINNYDGAEDAATQPDDNTFTGTNTFADISVEDFTASGSAALQGSLTVTGTTLLGPASASSLLLSSALSVPSGGTGRASFNNNEILIGQGTGALSSISNGTSGLCLMSTATAPSFQTCPGGTGSAGVSSFAGLTGDLLLANSSTSGSTITIDSATSSSRGIASFNAANLTVTSGEVNTVQDIAVSAAPTFAGLTVNGTINGQTISSNANFTGALTVGGIITANTITPNSSMVIGVNGQNLTLQGNASTSLSAANGANKTTLGFVSPSANVTYRLQAAAAGTYDVCTTVGNCVGVGGSVTTSGGTSGALARFNGSQTLVDSLLSESGSVVTVNGSLSVNTITPTAAMTIGASAHSLILQGDSSTRLSAQLGGVTNSLLFSAPSGLNKSIVLPNASGTVAVSASGPLAIDANGNITCASCTTSGGGAGGAVDSLNGINGAVLLNNASVAGSTITINDATTAAKGIASFNSTNFSVSAGSVNTVQDISVSSSPTFNALTLSTPLSVTSGGTGASTAAGARSNLGAASSGANTDITSLGGLSTAISISQGGTGATTSQGALNTLSQLSTEGDLLYFNGVNSTRLARGASGECLTSSTTAIAWSSCGPGEADTLATVTSRGATTNTGVFLQGGATTRGLTVDTATASDDTFSVVVSAGGASSFNGQITATDLTGNRTWTLPDASGTFCLQGSTSCGFLTGTASNYIQNQNAAQQATSTYWISGMGRADLGLQAPSFDTATATALTIGGTNATVLNMNQNTVLAASKSLTITGGATGTRPAVPTEGMVYYDTTTKQLITYANGKWQGDRSSSTKIVATSAVGGTSSAVASAAPDGADYVNTSDTSAQTVINAAIAALPAGGGTVYLMEGTYIVDGNINVPSNVTISGSGSSTIIKVKNATNADITVFSVGTTTRVNIQNLKVDGNKTTNTAGTQYGINFGAVGSGSGASAIPGIKLDSLEIVNFRNEGIRHQSGLATNSTITRVSTINNSGSGTFFVASATYMSITDNISQGNNGRGMVGALSNSTISGNTFSSNASQSGLEIGGSQNVVTGNTVTLNATGIYVDGINNVVNDNNVSSNTGTGISLDSSAHNATVSGNYVGSNGGLGVAVGSADRVSITDNTVSGNASYGIQLDLALQSLVADNYVYNNGGTGSASSIRVFAGCCGGANDNRIIDNVIVDTAGTGYAIIISSSSGTYLSGNTYSGTGATSISDAGTGTIYVNQVDANGNLINRGVAAQSFNTSVISSSLTLQGGLTNSQLPAPALPVISRVGTAGTTTYGYKVTALDGTGETLPSTEGTIATANATLTGANYNVVTWAQVPGAVQYKIYRTTSAGTPASTGLIATVTGGTTVSFNDTGIAGTTAAPGVNTTGGLSIASNIQGANATLAGGTVSIGTTAQQGSLVLSDGSSNTATLQVGNLAGNYTYAIPVTTGNDTFCMLVAANCGGVSAIGALDGGTANATGATISGSTFYLQSASGTNPGLVNTTTQTFAGNKTFTGTLSVQDTVVGAGTSIAFVGGITGTRPAIPTEGMVYFDTTTKQLITYANGKWQADRSSNTKIVGTSAAGGASGAVASAAPDGADFVNTSITSAQTVINSAITALPAGGGTVYLMEGTYIVDGTITLPSNVTLTGAGTATILKIKNATNASVNIVNANGGTNKVISSLKFDGNSANNSSGTQRAIDYGGAGSSTTVGVVMDKLDVQNFRSEAIYGVAGSHSKLTNSYIAANSEGMHSNGIDRIEISGNIFRAQTGNSISSYGARARITNNNVAGGTGILTSTESVIANNVVRSSTGNGINFGGTDSTITGNTVSGNAGIGIAVTNGTQRNIISGNTITDNGQHGIGFGLFTASITISNNIIHNSGTGTASSSGIAIDGYSGTNAITDNRITDTAGTGFAIFLNAPQNSNNYLSGNTFSGTGAASISDTADGTIYSNQVDGSGSLINRGNNGLAVGALAASSTLTVQGGYVGQALGAPAQPTVVTQGTAGSTSYTYAVTAFDGFGETTASTVRVIATGNTTLTGANFNRITWTRVSGAVSYKVYRTASGGTPATTGLIGTVGSNATLQLDDTGLAGSGTTPAANTTGGLSVASNIQGANATLTGGSLTLGTTSQQGSLILSDGSSNTATLQVGSLAGNYTYTIPVTTANDTFCMLTLANCSGGAVSAIGALDGGTANANGATISGSTLYLQSASGTNPGLVNTTTQTFAGNKTFTGVLTVQDTTVGAGNSITFVGGITGTRPASPVEGMIYFDTSTKQAITYANGKWQAARSTSTKIVAANNSSQAAKDAADYVATGTGDQSQINSALTAAAGGTVYLMEGTYNVNGQISIPNNTILSGAGAGTLLFIPNATNTSFNVLRNSDTSTGTNVVIRDLQIDGNRANQTSGTNAGINLGNMGAGTGASARIGAKISNVTVKNMRSDRGITLSGSNNIISGNTFLNNEIQAIQISSGSNNVITGNTFHGNQNYTLSIGGSYNTVSNNLIESGGSYGIYTTATNITISGNTLTGNGSAGMYIGGARATITGNTSSANAGVGIQTVADYATVTGNTISSNTGNGIQSQSNLGIISGNTVDNNTGAGIMLYDDSNSVSGNRVHNNGSHGIYCFGSCNNNSIVDNYITDTAGASFAIDLTNFGGTPTGNYLSNNHFSGTGASAINDEGSGTAYSNQKDGSGTTINRTQGGGFSVGTSSSSASLTLQGGLVSGQLSAPTLSATVGNVGTAGTTTYRYQVTALDGTGETIGSTIQQTTTGNASLNASNYNTISWTAVPGAYQYGIYKCVGAACTPLKKTTVAGSATSFSDQSAGSPVGAAPGTNTTGGATFAGGIQGSSATLTGGLTVAGTSALNGPLNVAGVSLFKNTSDSNSAFQIQNSSSVALFTADTSASKIIVRTLDVSFNLTVAGHIITGGSTPTIAANAAACTTPTVSVTGTDTAGTITITTGTGCATPGDFSTVTFATAYSVAPRVSLTPASGAAAGLNAYLNDATLATGSFQIGIVNTPTDSTVYKWNYHVLQ